MKLILSDEAATERLAAQLARQLGTGALDRPLLVYLQGDLGSGKTTLVRAWLHACGVTGPVKSPTYTLVEPYQLGDRVCYHLDLYRLSEPQELEFLGLEDWLAENAMILVEWPEKGQGVLPPADLEIQIRHRDANSRELSILPTGGLSLPDELI